jgi:hypothetical protein
VLDPLCAACVYIPPVISRGIHTDRARGTPRGGPEPLGVCGLSCERPPSHSERAAPTLAGEPRTARAERSPLLAREGSFGREMAGYFGLVCPTSTETARDFLRAVKLRHGTHSFTSLPKEGMLRIFYAWKKSDGFGRV